MKINISAGHNPDGKIASGAAGYILESTEARKVTDLIYEIMSDNGYVVRNCTCNSGTSIKDVLNKIVSKHNSTERDLDVSIHFNAGGGNGVETLIYSSGSKSVPYAISVTESIAKIGFKNRGVKLRPDLYFLKNTKAPAILIECCFVDSKEDIDKYNYVTMAHAIVRGIMGFEVQDTNIYKYQVAYNADNNNEITPIDGSINSKTVDAMKKTLLKAEKIETGYKVGSKGELVKFVQRIVNCEADGKYGVITRQAVIEYQKKKRIKADGIVGFETIKTMMTSN